MLANVGTTDRIVRVIAVVAALIGAFALGIGTVGGIALLVVAGILGVTAMVGVCPLYRVLGINTCPVSKG